jgi:pimeloyl-ACP methyl ester carboxylesterase
VHRSSAADPPPATGRIAHGHSALARPALDSSLRTRRFQVDGLAVAACIAAGRGTPVVFLHGNSSSKAAWAHQIRLVRQHGRPVLAPDLPGHGQSEDSSTPETTYSFPGYAGVIRRLLDAARCDEVDLVGWSLGGHIGLELLGTEPRVRSLLIVGTPPVRLCVEALHEAFYADDDMQLAGKADFTEADALTYGSAMMGGRRRLTSELLRHIRRTDGNARKFMFANALAGVGLDQRGLVERSAKPLCVVHGECEPFVRLGYLRSLRYRALWKDRVHVIARAGHAPHWERPAAFNAILSDFLALGVQSKKVRVISPIRRCADEGAAAAGGARANYAIAFSGPGKR